MEDLRLDAVRMLLEASLEEDVRTGDVTSIALVPESAPARAAFVAKSDLVVAGLPVVQSLVGLCDPRIRFEASTGDGDRVEAGTTLAELDGPARSILTAERTALNYIQHLSGVATLARRYVDAVDGTRAVVVDTRKTIPGYRMLEKYAVRCGGAANHRFGLYDAVLIKNNHLEFQPDPATAVRAARLAYPDLPLEVEVRDMRELDSALSAGPDAIMLDNFSPGDTLEAVRHVAGRVPLESSGGITLDNIRAYAEAGVDRISIGALTHSAPGADIHLRVTPYAEP